MIPKSRWLRLVVCATFGVASSALAQRNVYVLPSATAPSRIATIYSGGDAFLGSGAFPVPLEASQLLVHPTQPKLYVIARSGSETVVVLRTTDFSRISQLNLGQPATAAALSPDGRRLLVTAGSLRVIDTTADTELNSPGDVGNQPNDVAISIDSSRAFVLSPSPGRLTAVDLTTNTLAGTITIPGQPTSVSVAPNGFVYVTSQNRMYEIDGRSLTTRFDFPLNGLPGKPVFTPDGRFAFAPNRQVITGATGFVADLANRTVTNIAAFVQPGTFESVTLDEVVVVSNDRVFGFSRTTRTLYVMTLTSPGISIFGGVSDVTAVTASTEVPRSRWLYATTPTSIQRFDLVANPPALSGQLALSTAAGVMTFTGPAITGVASSILGYNNNQVIAPGTNSAPLVVRVVDALGRGLGGVPVTFQTPTGGAQIVSSMSATNSDGYAQAIVQAPPTVGPLSVVATAGAGGPGLTFSFTLASGQGGGGAVGGISIVSGNGQFVREQFQLQEAMVVVVRDAAGVAQANQTVTWNIVQGQGTLTVSTAAGATLPGVSCTGSTCTSITDSDGRAAVSFLATNVLPGFSFAATTISATTATGATVNFVQTTILSLLPGGGGSAAAPIVELIRPEDRRIVGQAGQTLQGAIQVRVIAVSGPQSGQPVPNIGLQVTTGVDPAVGPSASCSGGSPLSGADGIASCDLQLGGRLGDAQLTVTVGSAITTNPINLRVEPGPPGNIRIVQGNNQQGEPGQRLPLQFVAEVSDAFGNLLIGQPAQWEVVTPNTITLSNVVATTSVNGRVSAAGTLGTIPGTHQVRVRVGTVQATFSFTVVVSIARIDRVSGDGQTVFVSQAFPQPLVVAVINQQGNPVTGANVTFAVTQGTATLGVTSATTNAQGQASTSVTASATPGTVQVTATTGNFSTVFTLNVRPPGPIFAAANIQNVVSGERILAPGVIAVVSGTNIATNVTGTLMGQGPAGGPLPLELGGVSVLVDGTRAPIFSVNNIAGREFVIFQVPWELGAPSTVALEVRVVSSLGTLASTVGGIRLEPFSPGVFETVEGNRRFAILSKEDGTFVTPTNGANRGEKLCGFAVGLGPVLPATGTNRVGVAGQTLFNPLVVGINGSGVRVISAELAQNLIGVYSFCFEVPSTTAPSQNLDLGVAVFLGGTSYAFANSTVIASVR